MANKRKINVQASVEIEGMPVLEFFQNRVKTVISSVKSKLDKLLNGLHWSLLQPFQFIQNITNKIEDAGEDIKNSGAFGEASNAISNILAELSESDLAEITQDKVQEIAEKLRGKLSITKNFTKLMDFDLEDKIQGMFGNIIKGADKVAKDKNLSLFIVELIKALRQLKADTVDDSLRVILKELSDIVKADITIFGMIANTIGSSVINIANLPALLLNLVKTFLVQNPMLVFPAILEVITSSINILRELIKIIIKTDIEDFENFIINVRNAVNDDAILNVFERIARSIYSIVKKI